MRSNVEPSLALRNARRIAASLGRGSGGVIINSIATEQA
nr:hypothetical protein [Kibdelosporangium sp. MJ126-NF4]CTQ93049.1 hypothetical protein [Kibdelosporangium sp. MJ126-NF4]